MNVKRIGVLTSGGDAPGMNPCVRAVVRTALYHGIEVYGIRRGWNGLINGDVFEMDLRSVSDIIHRGGTVLYTARSKEFSQWEGVVKGADKCRELGIEGVVVIGGDGSFRGARDLTAAGIPCIGIPGTIDNDIACSDYTIGFDTAMNTAMQAIDKIRDTAQSHDRCNVVEVMGRHAGYIALEVGIAVGATAILVPEVKPDLDEIVERMIKAQQADKLAFDPDRVKRRKIYAEVCENFSDYCVFVGGSSSFDMAPKPYNKFYALDLYCRENGLEHENVLFIGDDYGTGGNDESVYLSDIPFLCVDDYTTFPERVKPLLED